jgi:hypothetical protein
MGSDLPHRHGAEQRKDQTMKRFSLVTATLFAAIVSAPSFASDDSKCANPNGSVEQRACTMAAAGPDALRRFVERTAGIYGLYYADFESANR